MVCIILFIILVILAFFGGRLFEFLNGEKGREEIDRINYQKKLLRIYEEKDIPLYHYFKNNKIRNIVIYGLGAYYKNFKDKIGDFKFDHIYLADGNVSDKQKAFPEHIYTKQELLDLKIDAVVVTSVSHYLEIKQELLELGISKEILSYSDLIYNAAKE